MHRTNPIPASGVLAEILRGDHCARGLHSLKPDQIQSERWIIGRDHVQQPTRQFSSRPALRQTVKRPGALSEPVQKPGVAQKLEMTGNPRLALTEDLGQIADRQFRPCAQSQKAKACRFSGGAKSSEQMFHE